jgi:hypothetical protein
MMHVLHLAQRTPRTNGARCMLHVVRCMLQGVFGARSCSGMASTAEPYNYAKLSPADADRVPTKG